MSQSLAEKKLRRAKRRRRVMIAKIGITAVLVCVVVIGGILIFGMPKVAEEITREAGSELPAVSEFLEKDYKDVQVVSGLDDSVNMNAVADYTVVIEVSGREYTSILHVVDTVKPVATAKDVSLFADNTAAPEDFIETIDDATDTTVAFVETPDFSVVGNSQVKLLVTDAAGNQTEVTANLEILTDTEAPEISGVVELTVAAGESVSYKRNVTVTDNLDEEVELKVDNSAVNLNEAGDYPITYVATDAAGNETKVETVLHVTRPTVETVTEDYINSLADQLLAKITTADMSQYDKAEAIFNWVHGNIGYYDGTPKTDWIQGAYHGLVEHSGDCFVYAMTSKVLLTRAGITNMDIEKIPARTKHYWNLIDLGDGWYHFDATRRKDGHYFFYTTDEEIMAYSNSHDGSHNYDTSLYPDIQ